MPEVWVAGIAGTLLLASVSAAIWPSHTRPERDLSDEIPELTTGYTEIAGVLAAVSLASAVFIGAVNKGGEEVENSIGLFVLSFIVLISAAMQYASTSSGRPELDAKFRIYSYVLASF